MPGMWELVGLILASGTFGAVIRELVVHFLKRDESEVELSDRAVSVAERMLERYEKQLQLSDQKLAIAERQLSSLRSDYTRQRQELAHMRARFAEQTAATRAENHRLRLELAKLGWVDERATT